MNTDIYSFFLSLLLWSLYTCGWLCYEMILLLLESILWIIYITVFLYQIEGMQRLYRKDRLQKLRRRVYTMEDADISYRSKYPKQELVITLLGVQIRASHERGDPLPFGSRERALINQREYYPVTAITLGSARIMTAIDLMAYIVWYSFILIQYMFQFLARLIWIMLASVVLFLCAVAYLS